MKRDAAPVCLFAIYDSPRDFPDHIVVRVWQFGPDGKVVPGQEAPLTFDIASLGHRGAMAAARGHCRRCGLSFLPRSAGDDPVIVETWKGRPTRIEANATSDAAGARARTLALG
jgi:hypothetical protein